jgi:hypothetical protein
MDEIKDFEELKIVIYFHNCLVVFLYISLKHPRGFFFFFFFFYQCGYVFMCHAMNLLWLNTHTHTLSITNLHSTPL